MERRKKIEVEDEDKQAGKDEAEIRKEQEEEEEVGESQKNTYYVYVHMYLYIYMCTHLLYMCLDLSRYYSCFSVQSSFASHLSQTRSIKHAKKEDIQEPTYGHVRQQES